MYRMVVLKQGLNRLHGIMKDTVRGCKFQTEMFPLVSGIQVEYFKKNQFDLMLIDLCENPEMGMSFIRQLRLAGVHSEIVTYIARNDCDTLRRVMRLGVVDCLVDPFDTHRFEQAVERFLRRVELFQKSEITQQAVDGLRSDSCKVCDLPKGLQKKTLNTIRAIFNNKPNTCFSCGDIVGTVNLSRITVQRYLSYLRQEGELIEAINYQTGGRPCSLYRYNIDPSIISV